MTIAVPSLPPNARPHPPLLPTTSTTQPRTPYMTWHDDDDPYHLQHKMSFPPSSLQQPFPASHQPQPPPYAMTPFPVRVHSPSPVWDYTTPLFDLDDFSIKSTPPTSPLLAASSSLVSPLRSFHPTNDNNDNVTTTTTKSSSSLRTSTSLPSIHAHRRNMSLPTPISSNTFTPPAQGDLRAVVVPPYRRRRAQTLHRKKSSFNLRDDFLKDARLVW